MEQNRGEGPNFELPGQLALENLPDEQAAEAQPAHQEQVGKRPSEPALPAIPQDIPVVDEPVIAAPPQDVAAPAPTDPHSPASDSDHIEPTWINKVKSVAAHTHDDPFLQKSEMSKVKAEYIQKRFNKTIKTDEAA
ncbi:MAG TPA: hypothetical protein VLF88_02915 [Candidatus Babeliales bacterium]|nr:hypothetical protein [Candidatus Babeliales bacterium]